jgi:probable rRNA maturation factor
MDERSYAEALSNNSAEIDVEVQIAPAFAEALSAGRLRAVAEAALRHEGASGQVTLVLTGDRAIRALNRDFLGIDAPTDVLAFSAREGDDPFVVAPGAGDYLGDVVISYPRAVAQAGEHAPPLDRLGGDPLDRLGSDPVEQELFLLVVHGLLHLLGYDHAGEEDKAVMWARQEAILQSLPANALS